MGKKPKKADSEAPVPCVELLYRCRRCKHIFSRVCEGATYTIVVRGITDRNTNLPSTIYTESHHECCKQLDADEFMVRWIGIGDLQYIVWHKKERG